MVTKEQVDNCRKKRYWDLGNQVLYDLCSSNFNHDTIEKVLAKTLLIGRAYAAAIERRKTKIGINDNFYVDIVAPTFMKSELDSILSKLKNYTLSLEALPEIVSSHNYLTNLLFSITELEKRSFSSKYLHFHLPNIFFIYDSRAVAAIGLFIKRLPKHFQDIIEKSDGDKQYLNFVYKCFYLRQIIESEHSILLTPRELDNILIEVANNKKVELLSLVQKGVC